MASAEDVETFEMPERHSLLFDGTKQFKRFKGTSANKVNFRDDTMIQRRCCSQTDCSRLSKDDLELGQVDDYLLDENQLTVMTLPAEFMRRPSMVSMRMKRDQLFQGTRTRRNPRVIYKDGYRNITFRKIPERSMLFFKDFVTTLVSESKTLRDKRKRYPITFTDRGTVAVYAPYLRPELLLQLVALCDDLVRDCIVPR